MYITRRWAECMNAISAYWFWSTIIAVFYFGLGYILPVLYTDNVVLITHDIFIALLFFEMIINWLCVRFIESPFEPHEHAFPKGREGDGLFVNGYEIDLDQVRESKNGFTVPTSNVIPNGRSPHHMNGHNDNGLDIDFSRIPPIPESIKNAKNLFLVALPQAEGGGVGHGKQLVFPYWSWKPCLICQTQRPPRTHHCPLCKKCVLKRDHHCFFTGTCIGLYNQRHFVVFNFWALLALAYCLYHSVYYLTYMFVVRNSWWDLLLPITCVRWLCAYVTTLDLIMAIVFYNVIWFFFTCLGFLREQYRLVRSGMTSFEHDNNIKITSVNSMGGHIKAVFGEKWWLNFLLPLHWLYPAHDDGVHWDDVKM